MKLEISGLLLLGESAESRSPDAKKNDGGLPDQTSQNGKQNPKNFERIQGNQTESDTTCHL